MSEKVEAYVGRVADATAGPVPGAKGATLKVLLGPEQGVPNFVTRLFTLEAGVRIPKHRHDSIEHEQVILEGSMTMGLDDRVVEVTKGDCVFIPAGVAHWYENRGSDPVRFLCIVPRTEQYRTEWMEED